MSGREAAVSVSTIPPDPTDVGTAPARPPRSWWPDRRPVQRWYAVTMLAVGSALVLVWVAATVAGIRPDGAAGWSQLVFGLGWITVAGLEVARPGPDRLGVVVYRCAFFLTLLTVVTVALLSLLDLAATGLVSPLH